MGVGYQGLQMALLAKRRQADFTRTLTLGRQHHYLNLDTLTHMFGRFGLSLDPERIERILADDFAEGLFQVLGATQVDSLDASGYEGANLIHDLNQPLPQQFVRQYSCVVDFGLLEHVFNFPVAMKSTTDLLEEGGYFISTTTANNFMGHGFYQFSPELFFNYLARNGFSNVEIYLIPYREFPYLFRVTDPQMLNGRVELVNNEPVLMGVLARKDQHLPEVVIPFQSDYYHHLWQGRDFNRASQMPPVEPHLANTVQNLKTQIAALAAWPETLSPHLTQGFENHLHYQLMDPAKD